MAGLKKHLNLFKKAWQIFKENHPIEFASSFAYFSLFGLPSILLIIVFLLSFVFDTSVLFNQLREQLRPVIGFDSADILVVITEKYMIQTQKNILNAIVYSITVFLLATQLIIFFQDILNDLWQIKPNFKNFWQKQVKERGLTFLMVIITGLLFYSSLGIEKALEFITGESLQEGIQKFIVNTITAILVFFWFAILYKVLAFVKIKMKPVLIGAAVTTVLFFIGLWLLKVFAVEDQSLEKLYDYAEPIVLISFWIFYNSLAFLYGASFTKVYAEMKGEKIAPNLMLIDIKWFLKMRIRKLTWIVNKF